MSAKGPAILEREQAAHRRLMRFGVHPGQVAPVWEERHTTVTAIATHLASLWLAIDAAADAETAGARTVTEKGLAHARASVLNLIAVVVDDGAAERVVSTLLELGVRHPSRAIVLAPNPEATGPGIDARISAHCTLANGGAERVCCEEVVLLVHGESAAHLAGIVAPLLIHDLPTHVWWPGDPPFRNPAFDQVIELCDRVLFDSSDMHDLAAGWRRVAGLRHHSGSGDLSWERLNPWQELTAQFFDAPRFRRYLPNINRLRIRYAVAPSGAAAEGVASPLAQSLLYAGWISTRLGWKRHRTLEALADGSFRLVLEGRHEMVDLVVAPEATDAVRAGDLLSVRMASRGETGAGEFIIDRKADDAAVATNADGMTALFRRVPMLPRGEAELLSAQLALDGSDSVYEDAMRAAGILLASAREAKAR